MKKIYFATLALTILSICVIDKALAQKYPTTITGDKGILVYVGSEADKNTYYVIERKESKQSNFAPLTVLTKPSTFVEFKSLLLHFSSMATSIDINGDEMIKNAWQELDENAPKKTLIYAFIPAVTLASGLAFYDTAVVVNSTYSYRVSVVKNGQTGSTKVTDPIEYTNKLISNTIASNYQRTDEKSVFVEWNVVGMPKPSTFEVYRSIVSKTDFSPIVAIRGFRTSGDTLFLVVKDTLVRANENYQYYIKAKDLFGRSFEPSEKVRVSASSNAHDPIVLKFSASSNQKMRAIELNYKISPSPNIRGLSIERSEEFDGKYELLTNVPATDSNFLDKTATPFKSYYYHLIINTLNGKTYPSSNVSGFLSLTQFLMAPSNLQSNQTPKGVELTWENTEPNIVGFIVYRCAGYMGKMEQISPIISPKDLNKCIFLDSLVQSKKIYSYAVRSVDKLMTESPFSDTVSATPLNNAVAPSAPTLLKAKVSPTEIFLTWDNIYANEPLLIGYNVYRKKPTEPETAFIKLNPNLLPNQSNYFSDTTLIPGSSWEYCVESIDMFNMKSPRSYSIEAALQMPKPVSPTGVRLYNQKEGIVIIWDEPTSAETTEYKLYRIQGEEKPKLIGTYKPGVNNALDKDVKADTYYVYYLTSTNKYQIESDAMEEMSVRR